MAKSIGNTIGSGIKNKPMQLITAEQFDAVTSTLSKERCKVLSDLMNELCVKYGITEKLPFRMFLANLLQESNELTHREENMNYSAKRMAEVWPDRFSKTKKKPYIPNDLAISIDHQPIKVANAAYNGRMGNAAPNDGWDYRGSGPIGLTGKELHTKYAAYIGKPVTESSNLIRTDDRQALDSSCWFFAVYKKLIPVANTGNFKGVCSLINTGSINKTAIGMDVRQKYYDKINAVLG